MNNTRVEVYLDGDELEEVKALCLFYGTRSYIGLVEAMSRQIERLQKKLAESGDQRFYLTRVREG